MAKKPYSLKRMSVAVARDDGKAIKFAFETHKGEILEFECPPIAIPEIIAKLMSAGEQAAKYADPIKEGLAQAVHVDKYVLGASRKGPSALMMHLFPAPNCPIGFHLSLELADKLASDLPDAIATIRKGTTTLQ